MIKISAIGEAPGAVDFQIGALRHLESCAPGLPVPRMVPSRQGNLREWILDADHQRHMVRVLSWLPGTPVNRGAAPTPALFRHAATFQARLARALRGYFHPEARHFVAWDLQRALVLDPALHTHVGADALALVRDFLRHVAGNVLPRLPALPAHVIHGDGHDGNLLRAHDDADEITGIIDFGDMVHGPRVQDIAVTIASFTRCGTGSLDAAAAQLEAYNAVLPLEDDEIALLHDLVLLRLATALFLYDFRIAVLAEPPDWLATERPEIVAALRAFLALDRDTVHERYRAACGRVSRGRHADVGTLRARRDRVLGPSYRLFYRDPVHLMRGEGVWLYDADGRRYLDCYNNVASVGHCHPHVVGALARQAATLNTHTRYLDENVVRYAERLTATMPAELSVCMLVCTGTEANDLAIRIARTVSGNQGIIVSDDAYHGNSNVVNATSTSMYPRAEQPAWIATVPPPNGFRGPHRYGTPDLGPRYATYLDEAMATLAKRGQGTAAFLCDTVFDSSGPALPPPGYLERAATAVRAAGGLFIADEVQAGFYRTGERMWGFAYADVVPDIVTLGKPIGAGHPLAAVITTPAIASAFARKYSYFNTFGGNAVSAVVGMAVLDVLEQENVQRNVIAAGARLAAGLACLREKYPVIGDVRGRGLFWGLDMVTAPGAKDPAPQAAERIINLLREDGFLLGCTGAHDNVIKIRPPLVFTPDHAGMLLEAMERAVAKC